MKGLVVLQILLPAAEVQRYNMFGFDYYEIIKTNRFATAADKKWFQVLAYASAAEWRSGSVLGP